MTGKKTNPENSSRKPKLAAATFVPPEDGLGERVLMLRTQKGLSHESLSALTKLADSAGAGISRTSIRGYELGNFKPGARELRILSKALQVSPGWLLLGEESDRSDLPKNNIPAYGEVVQLMMAFSTLDEPERTAIKTIVFNMLKYKLGEVEFRKLMGFGGDFGSMIAEAHKEAPLETKTIMEGIESYWNQENLA